MIHNCEYLSPTRRVIGSDALDKIGPKLKEDGAHKVLIHYGGGDYLYHGLLDRVKKSLADSGLEYVDFPGVKPNPRLSKALEGAEFAKANGVDYILSVGGGSAVDSAKAISLGMSYEGDLWDLWKKADTLAPDVVLTPVAGVIVYPATGAEAGSSSVILNEETREKFWEWDERLFPHFCFMDPQYTMTLPRHLLTNGIGDIMSHFTDNYLTDDAHFGIFDNLLETTMHYLQAELSHIILDPERDNLADRTELMAVASMGCDDSINWGLNHEKASHQIAHPIGGLYDTTHGSTLSIIYPQWLKYMPIYQNMTLAKLRELFAGRLLNRKTELEYAEKSKTELSIKLSSVADPVETLSGGNQQKVVLAKWMLDGLKVLILDEPTKGIDIGAKEDVFNAVDSLAEKGIGIIFISSDLDEVFRVSDKLLIMDGGRVIKEMKNENVTEAEILDIVLRSREAQKGAGK